MGTAGVDDTGVLEPLPVEHVAPFADFYRDNYRAVVGLAYGLSGSRSAAEDLAQEAFAAAHRRWAEVSGYDDPGAWVRRVAVNRAASGVRRRAAEARAVLRLAGRRELPAELSDGDARVWTSIRALPTRQAQAIALFYYDGRSVAEIAAILACTEGTVKTHLHRGREALAAVLGTTEEEEQGS